MKSKLLPIILVSFVNVIGFTLLLPILPKISESLVGSEIAGVVYGLLLSSYAMSQFFATPLLGALSDKFGRRPILLLSQLGTTLSWAIFASSYFIPSSSEIAGMPTVLIIIAISRITDGITGGNNSVAQAWISDSVPKENRAQIFNILGAVFGLGLLLGPAIGGLSYNLFGLGYLSTAILALLLSIITTTLIALLLPESLPKASRQSELKINLLSELNLPKQFLNFRPERLIFNIFQLKFIFALVFASFSTLISIILALDFGLDTGQIGLTISVFGIYSIVNRLFLVKIILNKLGELRTLFVGVSLIATILFLLPFSSPQIIDLLPGNLENYLLFLGLGYFIELGISMAQPTFKSVLVNNSKEHQLGKVTGLDESLWAFGQGLTPIIAGLLFSILSSITFLVYGVLLAITVIVIRLRLIPYFETTN